MNSWKARRPPAWELKCFISGIHELHGYSSIPSVKNVHEWDWEDVRLLGASEIRDVGVEWDALLRVSHPAIPCGFLFSLAFSAAPAFATAIETPRMALAPNLVLLAVPSNSMRKSSTAFWSLTSRPFLMSSGPMTELTLSTAFKTPFPPHLVLSPSRSSQASCWPVISIVSFATKLPTFATHRWKLPMGRWHGEGQSR